MKYNLMNCSFKIQCNVKKIIAEVLFGKRMIYALSERREKRDKF